MNVKINKRNSQPQNLSTLKQDSLNIVKPRQTVRTSKVLDIYKKQKLGFANLNEEEAITNSELDVEKKNIVRNNIIIKTKENKLKELKDNLKCKNNVKTVTVERNSSIRIRVEKRDNNAINFTNEQINTSNEKQDDKENLNNKNSIYNMISTNENIKRRDISVNHKRPQMIKMYLRNSIQPIDSNRRDKSSNPLNLTHKINREETKENLTKQSVVNTPSNKNEQVRNSKIANNISKFSTRRKSEDKKLIKEESDMFEYEEDKKEELSNDEKLIYGIREPKNYKKIKLIGKGGCGVVWLCENLEGKEFAVKQIPKKSKNDNVSYNISKKEIQILNHLNSLCSTDTDNFMINMFEFIEDTQDIWLVFEKSGKSLSSLSFKIKGEFLGNERIYSIKKGRFLVNLFEDVRNFKDFFKKLLNFFIFLNENQVIHCDIKPENILIDFSFNEENPFIIKQLKVIDFGSAFFINNPENFSSNTPEYMSPEITELIEKGTSIKEISNFLKSLKQWPWCIDMWSLGVTILELILSCPLWMSYKAKVIIHGRTLYKTGLFGVKGRCGTKIYNKQIEVSNSIYKLLNNCLIKEEHERSLLGDLLSKMLDLNYKTRISPIDALNHPFLNKK